MAPEAIIALYSFAAGACFLTTIIAICMRRSHLIAFSICGLLLNLTLAYAWISAT